MKDFIIISIILIIIIGGAIYTQKYIDKTSQELTKDLNDLKKMIIDTKQNGIREILVKRSNEVYNKWSEIEEGWALVVLHSELDLIETSFIRMKTAIEENEMNRGLEELETCIFLINHISEKEKLCLKNIF
ncbi:MAG: DUF4363 family protein [Clostridiales bacterium]|nr:DUF4363 family protein [Clostridiales bacterium]